MLIYTDKEADLEACKILTTNAENLTSAISKALYYTHSASIRVAMATKEELGLLSICKIDTRTEQHDVWFNTKEKHEHTTSQLKTAILSAMMTETSTPGFTLSTNDLTEVLNTIWDARVQWYNVGLGLGLSPDSLDAINADNQNHCDRCFRCMLTQWLRRDHPRPTWHSLAEALRSPSVNMNYIAEQLPS